MPLLASPAADHRCARPTCCNSRQAGSHVLVAGMLSKRLPQLCAAVQISVFGSDCSTAWQGPSPAPRASLCCIPWPLLAVLPPLAAVRVALNFAAMACSAARPSSHPTCPILTPIFRHCCFRPSPFRPMISCHVPLLKHWLSLSERAATQAWFTRARPGGARWLCKERRSQSEGGGDAWGGRRWEVAGPGAGGQRRVGA